MKRCFLLFLSLAAAAQAGSDFHAYLGTEELPEVGQVEKLTVVTSQLLFTIRPPRNWYRQTDEASRKIIFTSLSGRSAITVQFTGNSPGALPARDILQTQALQAHPGASLVQSGVAPASREGIFFDLVRMPSPGVIQRIRHAYLSQPAGEVEFVLAASDDEFEKTKKILTIMLRALRVEPLPPKKPAAP